MTLSSFHIQFLLFPRYSIPLYLFTYNLNSTLYNVDKNTEFFNWGLSQIKLDYDLVCPLLLVSSELICLTLDNFKLF